LAPGRADSSTADEVVFSVPHKAQIVGTGHNRGAATGGVLLGAGLRTEDVRPVVERRFNDYLERIRELCRLPSVSATGEGIRETAGAVATLIEESGGTAELVETPGHPVVLGEIPGPPGAPTLTRYGMYDVQPPEGEWSSPPFAAEILDLPDAGPSVVGRGTANSKGSLAAFFCALDALRETGGVPVSFNLVVEGEEELGSPHLPQVVRDRSTDLAADAGVDFDLYADRSGASPLVLGCKGLLSVDVICRAGEWGGPRKDLHSSEAAWIASPVWQLVHALAALVGPDEEILVPALLEAARGPGPEDRRLLEELAEGWDPDLHLAEAGASRFKLDASAAELLEALIFRPTANIDGLEAGYTGPGGMTIIPDRARAVLDVRLVPDLEPESAVKMLRERLDEAGFPFVEVEMLDSYPWAKSEPDSAVARAMRVSYERLGRQVLPYPMAPWCAPFYIFDRILGIPWASGGLGHSGGAHAPDEFVSVEGLKEHIMGVAEFCLAAADLVPVRKPEAVG
jgi:acetylornithine deacetylase/succinyl-diaminopimelate desuccinylase-like protein